MNPNKVNPIYHSDTMTRFKQYFEKVPFNRLHHEISIMRSMDYYDVRHPLVIWTLYYYWSLLTVTVWWKRSKACSITHSNRLAACTCSYTCPVNACTMDYYDVTQIQTAQNSGHLACVHFNLTVWWWRSKAYLNSMTKYTTSILHSPIIVSHPRSHSALVIPITHTMEYYDVNRHWSSGSCTLHLTVWWHRSKPCLYCTVTGACIHTACSW